MNIQSTLDNLSLKEQLLQLLMLDIRYFEVEGKSVGVEVLPNELVGFFQEYSVGGIILFAENCMSRNSLQSLIKQLQHNAIIPRFIAIDQEGGVVSRILDTIDTPGNMALGAINDTSITQNVAQIIGQDLKNLGVNLNFAPVVDINSNPLNPVIGVRSFSSDKEIVLKHARSYLEGVTQSGIIGCIKHFPGHGDTSTDTHHILSYINHSKAEVLDQELYPFHELIKSNTIDMIMTAHIAVPSLDSNQMNASKSGHILGTPATFSKPILTDLLAKQLGFNGIVISDALDMGAISDNFTMVDASLNALNAGVDILLMPFRIWSNQALVNFKSYFEELYQYISQSKVLREQVYQSCFKVLRLKAKYLFNKDGTIALNYNQISSYIREVSLKGVSLVKNSVLPWKIALDDKVVAIAINDLILDEIKSSVRQLGYFLDCFNYDKDIASILNNITKYNKVILCSYNLKEHDNRLQSIIDKLNYLGIPYVLLSARNPYDINYLHDVGTNILIYGVSGFDQTNYQIKKFTLNLKAALYLLYNANDIIEFNTFSPVELNLNE